jgi:hypothetical protein
MVKRCHKCNRKRGGVKTGGRKKKSRKSGGRLTHRRKGDANKLMNEMGRKYKGGFLPMLAASLLPALAPVVGNVLGKVLGKGLEAVKKGGTLTGGELMGGRSMGYAMRGGPEVMSSLGSVMSKGGALVGGKKKYVHHDKRLYEPAEEKLVIKKGGKKKYVHHDKQVYEPAKYSLKKRKGAGSRRSAANNPWIQHVKAYAKKHKIPYAMAVSEAKASYRK